MKTNDGLSRRSFLAFFAAAPLGAAAVASAKGKQIPVGLELYSVRKELANDRAATVRQVAHLGYKVVEYFSPYYNWTTADAKKARRELDNLGIHCYSTHNDLKSFQPDGIGKAMELNHILGTKFIVLASPGEVSSLDGWKRVADTINKGNQTMMKHGFHAGYHNDDHEWKELEGKKPIDVLVPELDKSVILQVDTGNCLMSGGDPVKYIRDNPGRVKAMHLKDWSPQRGYDVVIGQGSADWNNIFKAAETVGGVEYYLIEQEGLKGHTEMESAKMSLAAFRKVYGKYKRGS